MVEERLSLVRKILAHGISLTPCFSSVCARQRGFQPFQRFFACVRLETAEAVKPLSLRSGTLLKQGVNEKLSISSCNRRPAAKTSSRFGEAFRLYSQTTNPTWSANPLWPSAAESR